MNSRSSSEAKLFIDTNRAFLDKQASLADVRALHAEDHSYDSTWWKHAAQLGWTSLLVPEHYGGASISEHPLCDVAAISEQLGYTAAPGPLHPVSIVLTALVNSDNHSEHTDSIAALASGDAVAAWAVDEPGRPYDPQHPIATATRTDSGYRLNGSKDRVEAGPQSDLFLVSARTDDGPRQFLVTADAPGVTLRRQRCIDLVKHYARIDFDDVDIPESAVVGSAAQTPALIELQSHTAIVLQCAETVGILDAVMAMTTAWARDRHSFGRPLASYQALKHRFADMTVWQHACRAITTAAVAAAAAARPDAASLVSAAKSYLGEHAGPLIHDCIQLHGGIGVTWEHDLHVYLRRITLYRSMLGTPTEHHRAIYHANRGKHPA